MVTAAQGISGERCNIEAYAHSVVADGWHP